MKPTQFTAPRTVCAFTALLWTTHLTAQEAARSTPPTEEEIRYDVQSTRILPDGGRNIILQRVSPPVLPAPPSPRLKLPSTLQELTALANAKADRTTPFRSRLVVLNVTAFPGGITYLEWLPKGGGSLFAAWSNADFRLMSLVPDFEIDPGNTRYSILQIGAYATFQPHLGRPPLASAPSPVSIPRDGPGFVLVEGDPSDKESINPIAALHQIYKEDAAQLKAAWEEGERVRKAQEAWRAANPPPPPGDLVIRMWPVQSRAYSIVPVAPASSGTSPSPSKK